MSILMKKIKQKNALNIKNLMLILYLCYRYFQSLQLFFVCKSLKTRMINIEYLNDIKID